MPSPNLDRNNNTKQIKKQHNETTLEAAHRLNLPDHLPVATTDALLLGRGHPAAPFLHTLIRPVDHHHEPIGIPTAALWDASVGGVLYGDVDIGGYSNALLWPNIGVHVDGNNRMGLYLPPYGGSGDTTGVTSVVGNASTSSNYVTAKRRAWFACQQIPNALHVFALNGALKESTISVGPVAPAYATISVSLLSVVSAYVRNLRLYNCKIDISKATAL